MANCRSEYGLTESNNLSLKILIPPGLEEIGDRQNKNKYNSHHN
ncbi:MAG: hypothetical protein QNJ72_36160 [Pleurocapsa sp. MO_226.B13]|nr:hypothetical protein [Pleurocapsa sp. MO_226.B13]